MTKKLALLALLSFVCTTPVLAQEPLTLAESKLFVAPSTAIQRLSESINLVKGQEKLQLMLTYYNGTSTQPGFTMLRISSPSMNYVTEHAFVNKTFSSNVTGELTWGGNQLLITAQGPKGAEFGWRLTTPKPVLTGITPQTVMSGGTLTVSGTNLCPDVLGNIVQINGKEAHCISASADKIVVKIPDDATGGANNVAVSVAGINAGTLPFTVNATPYLKNLSASWVPVGGEFTIYGEGFDSNPAHITVFVGPLQAPIVSSTPTSITCTIPAGFGGMPWGYYQPVKVTVNGNKARNQLTVSSGEVSPAG